MCNYSNVPVSKHNSFPSANHVFVRMARYAACYGGEFDNNYYQQLLAFQHVAAPAIAQLQAAGEKFTTRNTFLWVWYLCGTFEITHSQFVPPSNTCLPPTEVLYGIFTQCNGL